MPEKNVDKIKRLEHELERYKKKVHDQHKEFSRLNQAVEAMRGDLRELNLAMDAVLISVAIKYGAEVGVGAFEATLPMPKVDELLRHWQMSVALPDGQYVIRAVRREDGGGDGD